MAWFLSQYFSSFIHSFIHHFLLKQLWISLYMWSHYWLIIFLFHDSITYFINVHFWLYYLYCRSNQKIINTFLYSIYFESSSISSVNWWKCSDTMVHFWWLTSHSCVSWSILIYKYDSSECPNSKFRVWMNNNIRFNLSLFFAPLQPSRL